MEFRECGDCTICCTWLIGESYGHSFGCGKSCKFLDGNKCGIYEKRPDVCKKYQCAWSQHLIPYEMRPDKCGIIISVESKSNKNFLKAVIFQKNNQTGRYVSYLNYWAEKMNTEVIFMGGGEIKNV